MSLVYKKSYLIAILQCNVEANRKMMRFGRVLSSAVQKRQPPRAWTGAMLNQNELKTTRECIPYPERVVGVPRSVTCVLFDWAINHCALCSGIAYTLPGLKTDITSLP